MSTNKFYLNLIRTATKLSLEPPKWDCIPKHDPVQASDVVQLQNFIKNSGKILVLTGAGISTESGIPDYRSEVVGLYARSNHRPVQYHEFLKLAGIRQRYWARNYIGWPRFSQSQPNETHRAITNLERHGKVSSIVTQNVDSLHFKAGSRNVIELHGSAFRVFCLNCGQKYKRQEVQEKLSELNPHMTETSKMIRPDGDVEIDQEKIQGFKPPFCDSCQGILKPDITFFGDNVPKDRVEAVRQSVSSSDSILVLGSSLHVFSGYRIILQAKDELKRICIVNIGPTRADHLANIKIAAKCGEIFPQISYCR